MSSSISAVKGDLNNSISAVKGDLKEDIADVKELLQVAELGWYGIAQTTAGTTGVQRPAAAP
jgi:hypothetical protein